MLISDIIIALKLQEYTIVRTNFLLDEETNALHKNRGIPGEDMATKQGLFLHLNSAALRGIAAAITRAIKAKTGLKRF